MKQYGLISLLLVVSFILNGCGDLLKPVTEPTQARYIISPKLTIAHKMPSSSKILQVDAVSVAPGYQTQKMAYIRKPYQLEYFTRNQWAANPNQLLRQPLIDALKKSGYYRQVVGSQMIIKADQRLLCELIQLHQNYLTQPSQIQLVMQVNLIDNNSQRIIASRQFTLRQSAPFDTPYGGVLATNQAVTKLQQQLVDFVVQSSRGLG